MRERKGDGVQKKKTILVEAMGKERKGRTERKRERRSAKQRRDKHGKAKKTNERLYWKLMKFSQTGISGLSRMANRKPICPAIGLAGGKDPVRISWG